MPAPLSGRKAQAARNDGLIVEAAREVFVADPTAPIAAVAERAGVGISALYRRYPSKEDLLRKLCADGLTLYTSIVEKAVEASGSGGDPWESFATFMREVVAADTHSITNALAGTFTPSPELYEMARRSGELNERLVARTRQAGVVRADLDVGDLGALFGQLAAVGVGDPARDHDLRQRYLTIILDGLRVPPVTTSLPSHAPTLEERARQWVPA
ncbi:TetR/AcrR family transcriptional regulator [Actinophytocola algeriensis]|uniref:AcrR family transcriptional regulator n=1 Tax=Actinophytocola algeriensis TaxID=1768010 RepID=A0A7W7QAQ9_9PSEU|nr:TetR/AcrR family transcriptional regulator [Actinophytocola algeriensis]MBB4909814.1 AcrR family transcriptional regulator [Actinophytocola algeriensis]MBE1475804.1 AcrR family transcriptional regulator [Actinophytocola algeriensis]